MSWVFNSPLYSWYLTIGTWMQSAVIITDSMIMAILFLSQEKHSGRSCLIMSISILHAGSCRSRMVFQILDAPYLMWVLLVEAWTVLNFDLLTLFEDHERNWIHTHYTLIKRTRFCQWWNKGPRQQHHWFLWFVCRYQKIMWQIF
jgi:hypothetical protein